MNKEYFLSIFVVLLIQDLALGQTGEVQFFYHPQYFNDSIVTAKKIKKITVTNFWTRPEGKMYQDQITIYKYNEKGVLECSESYYFKPFEPKTITQQTIDCNEYQHGLQIRHVRYHDSRDSAEWIQEFDYELDQKGNITKIIVKDLSHPHNSNVTEKFYDSKNRLTKTKTDYGYLTEYIYDEKDNLIERIWGPEDGQRNRNLYSYDDAGNLIKYEFKGKPFDNFDTMEETNKYDSQNRIIYREKISADNEKSIIKYSYQDKSIVKSEYLSSKGDIIGTTIKRFSHGLIQSVVTEREGITHSKEIFEYEYY